MRVTREDVIDLIKMLPADRLVSVYDFVSFIQTKTSEHSAEAQSLAHDLFGDTTDEELHAEEERWDQLFASTEDKLLKFAEKAEEAYRTGKTTGIDDSSDELKPAP